MVYPKLSKEEVLSEYLRLKKTFHSLRYNDLRSLGSYWFFESEKLDEELISLSTDDDRDNYLDEYLEKLDKEIQAMEKNSLNREKKLLFKIYLIFKFYPDDYKFEDEYYDLKKWYLDFYKADVADDGQFKNDFRVIRGRGDNN